MFKARDSCEEVNIVSKQPTNVSKASGGPLGKSSGQRPLSVPPMAKDFTGGNERITTCTDAIQAATTVRTLSLQKGKGLQCLLEVSKLLAGNDTCAFNCRKTSFFPYRVLGSFVAIRYEYIYRERRHDQAELFSRLFLGARQWMAAKLAQHCNAVW